MSKQLQNKVCGQPFNDLSFATECSLALQKNHQGQLITKLQLAAKYGPGITASPYGPL